ncbi:MATE family efflux transporter [Sediminitomix flava]|uniref:Multidrug-efflux transporter n=1 Tax=Sediminitomix flava TaxID=379075 RepID=A0A315ZFF1_SEDFL|nr:MATE family efflux transporter [Sediminitomix flava]PWJ44316.1 putative MATE family efflux protein [Sediminitomix flava]
MDLLKSPTNKVLRSMSLPVGFGMLSTILFQVVDTYFVGTLGAESLTALGFASTVYFLLVGLFIGLSVAVSIILGKAFGEGNPIEIKQISTLSVIISFVVGLVFTAIGISSIDSVFSLLGANAALIADIKAYMVPLYLGMPLLSVGIVAGSILRTKGMASKPEIVFGIAGVINLILNYVLIFGKFGFPQMGIQGVAIGTVVSWVFIFICMAIFLFQERLLSISSEDFSAYKTILQSLFQLGLPSVLTQLISPFTLMLVTFLLGKVSADTVASFGVASRIETLLLIGIMAVCTASTPFIAQNFGAKLVQRIEEAIVFGGKASFYLGAMAAIVLYLFIKPVAGIFSEDEQIIATTANYFYIVSLSYIFHGLYLVTIAIFNGLQLPQKALRIMLVKTFGLTLPLTIAGYFFGAQGIFIALGLSNLLGGLYAAYEMRKELKRVGSSLKNRNPVTDMMSDFKLAKTN